MEVLRRIKSDFDIFISVFLFDIFYSLETCMFQKLINMPTFSLDMIEICDNIALVIHYSFISISNFVNTKSKHLLVHPFRK